MPFEQELRAVLDDYLTLLQRHPSAEEMMDAILTEDFETGFEGGFTWRGMEGPEPVNGAPSFGRRR